MEIPEWAQRLAMSPHPEGGWFCETWRSELTIAQSVLPPDYTGPRSAGTAILFLLMPGQQSAWHTVRRRVCHGFATVKNRLPMPCVAPTLSCTTQAIVWMPLASCVVSMTK